MDDRARIDNSGRIQDASISTERGLIRPRPVVRVAAEPPPDPIHVLARMPNLDAEPSTDRGAGRTQSGGRRREESRTRRSPVAVALLVAAGVLLLAAAVVPVMLGKKDTTETAKQDKAPAWQPEEEAVGHAAKAPLWGGDATDLIESDPVIPTVAGQEAQAEPVPHAHAYLPAQTPPTVQLQASPLDGEPKPAEGQSPVEVASWRDPGRWPYGNGVGQPVAGTPIPNQYPQTVNEADSLSGSSGASDLPAMYQAPSEADRPGRYENFAQPESGMNRSMALGAEEAASQPWGTPIPQTESVAVPSGGYLPAAPSQDPVSEETLVGERYASRPAPQTVYPYTGPSDPVPAGVYPNTVPATSGQTSGAYPTADSPNGTYIGSPIPPGYGAGTQVDPQTPGVARLQGVIEKPSVRMTNDYNRPGLY